jgi:hypothetical protein
MPRVSINLTKEEVKILEKRAKKNIMSLREQIEDIVRRSCVNYKKKPSYKRVKPDDRLVSIFSREMRGRPRKKK